MILIYNNLCGERQGTGQQRRGTGLGTGQRSQNLTWALGSQCKTEAKLKLSQQVLMVRRPLGEPTTQWQEAVEMCAGYVSVKFTQARVIWERDFN